MSDALRFCSIPIDILFLVLRAPLHDFASPGCDLIGSRPFGNVMLYVRVQCNRPRARFSFQYRADFYVVGITLQPQCLHTRAALRINSWQSGQRTCVSGVGASGFRFFDGIISTAINAKTLKRRPKRNQTKLLRPRELAAIAVRIDTPNHRNTSIYPPSVFNILHALRVQSAAPRHAPPRTPTSAWVRLSGPIPRL